MKNIQSAIFICLMLILITATAIAQEQFRASLSMGPVIPLGKFSSANITSTKSGYGQSGFNLNIDGDYYIDNRFAVTLRFLFENSTIDNSNYQKFLKTELSDYISATDTVHYDINYWQWTSPMVGIKYNYPIVMNKLYIETGIFSGINFLQIPDQNLLFTDETNKRTIISQNVGTTDITIPLAVSCGLRYRINPKMQLKLNAEYFRTKTSFEHVSYYQNENTTDQKVIKKYTSAIPIQTLNLSLGLVYNF